MTEDSRRSSTFLERFSSPKIWLLIAAIFILIPLIFYAYLGTFSRLQADDYCYAWNATSRSLIDSQATWYRTDSSRYAATFMITLAQLAGERSILILPALVIALWLLGACLLFNRIQTLFHLELPIGAAILLGEIWIFFTLLLAPNRYQVLYWRAGLFIYLFPLVVLSWLGYLILNFTAAQKNNRLPLYSGLLLILFYFNGGFSETIAAVLIGMLSLSLLLIILFLKGPHRKQAITLVGFSLLGAALALLTLFFSPATRMRQGLIGPPPDLISLIQMSIKNAFIYMYITLGDQAFTLLILLLLGMLSAFSIVSIRKTDTTIKPSSLAALMFLVPLGAFLWILCVTAPFAYGESSYPEARVLVNATAVLVMLVLVEGLVMGFTLGLLFQRSDETPSRLLSGALILVLLVLSLYPLYTTRQVYAVDYPLYKQRAVDWDQREAYIRSQLAEGNKDLSVTTFFRIGDVLEFNPDPNNWLNGCAAMYYGADSITAISP